MTMNKWPKICEKNNMLNITLMIILSHVEPERTFLSWVEAAISFWQSDSFILFIYPGKKSHWHKKCLFQERSGQEGRIYNTYNNKKFYKDNLSDW